VALHRGFGILDLASECVELLETVPGPVPYRMNDGRVDPSGRFWAGAMTDGLDRGQGGLWSWVPGTPPVLRLAGLTIPNGIDWSVDGRRMYVTDSGNGTVDVFNFDVDTGGLSNHQPFVSNDLPSMPDGLTVDADDCVWIATYEGRTVERRTPNGDLDRVVDVPAARVTSCAFGDDGASLYITTATGASPGLALDGSLFVCRPGALGKRPATGSAPR
jgi:sugar lactone lactonase YvrE